MGFCATLRRLFVTKDPHADCRCKSANAPKRVRKIKVEIDKSTNDQFFVRVVSPNGRKFLQTELYPTHAIAAKSAKSLKGLFEGNTEVTVDDLTEE